MSNEREYNYLMITAHNPNELREMDRNKAKKYIGLYDGENFAQPVICPTCGHSIYFEIERDGYPERIGVCNNCKVKAIEGKLSILSSVWTLHYLVDTRNHRRQWESRG